jgi:hypothetical protein
MRTLIELIERHEKQFSDFKYYIPIIEKAERNEIDHPDVTIECCTSLFQGISKSIIFRLDSFCDKESLEKKSLQAQVKQAFQLLGQEDDVIEIGFPTAVENLARVAGTLRNQRGDISHGRATPKELYSDASLSRLVLSVSEAVLRYMLASFFFFHPAVEIIAYEDNQDFNDLLDEMNPLEGKPLYSLALFDQYYEDYTIRLVEYVESQDETVD